MPSEADATKRLRELIRTLEGQPEKAQVGSVRSVREATNNVSRIVASALAGEPQIIRRPDGRAVIVMSVETAKDLVALTEPRSLAAMFPVDEDHPPVSPIRVTHRPGWRRVGKF